MTQETWHMSENGLHVLGRKNIMSDVIGMHFETCVDCLTSRQRRMSFQRCGGEG